MKTIGRFLLSTLITTLILNTKLYAINSTIIVESGGTMHCHNEKEYFVNNEIDACSGSTVIFDKPATISENGTFNIEGSFSKSTENGTSVKFNSGLTVFGSVLTNGCNWDFNVYDMLVLSGNVHFGQQVDCNGEVKILSGNKNAIFDVSSLTSITNPVPGCELTVVGDGATQLQYMTDNEINNAIYKEKAAIIQTRLENIINQPMNMKKMIIKDYEVSNVTTESVQVVKGEDGTISSKLNGFETLINDVVKLKCQEKGLIISAVEISPEVKKALSDAVLNELKTATDSGEIATLKEWPPTPMTFEPPDVADPEAEKVIKMDFNIGDLNNDSDSDSTKVFTAQLVFTENEPGENNDNKVEINGNVAKNVILKFTGNANAVEVASGNMPRLDFSELVDHMIKVILRSSDQSSKDNGLLNTKLRDDTNSKSNIINIDEETFVLGDKKIRFETGNGNIINFLCKSKDNPFTFEISDYVAGENSITNINTGVNLLI